MKILTDTDRKILLDCMHRKQDSRLYKRMHAVILYDDGFSVLKISKMFYMDEETIRSYIEDYRDSGIPEAKIFKHHGKPSALTKNQQAELKSHLSNKTYNTALEICAYVLNKYDVTYIEKGMAKLLKRLGFVYKKAKLIPGKADKKKQKEFLEKTLKPLLDIASDENPLYFNDAVHPTHNVLPRHGWILKEVKAVISSNTGRKRININGAVCFHSMDVVIREDETINAESTLNLLKQIRVRHSLNICPKIVLDNAKYNKTEIIKNYAEANNIQLIYLPSYSPNLNLIERLWHFMKEEVCSKYYEKFNVFRETIMNFFKELPKKKEKLKTLLSPNFQILGT